MKKVYSVQNLCCAHCAALIEKDVQKIKGVQDATLNFILQRLTVTFEDEAFEDVKEGIKKAFKKIEPDAKILGL